MLVEPLWATFALTLAVTLCAVTLLLEVVEHLRAVTPTILLVKATTLQLAIHRSELILLVVVGDLDVNHIVTCHVRKLCVLLV